MKRYMKRILLAAMAAVVAAGCCTDGDFVMGTYGYDAGFLARQGVGIVELKSPDGQARVIAVPGWQGRVMTSTAGGPEGRSFGWINHKFIASGEVNPQFNSFGGEERFWIGPEGGPFSYYFKEGQEQVYANWKVPGAIDTEGFDIISQNAGEVVSGRDASFVNASGTVFEMGLRRKVNLLDRKEIASLLGVCPGDGVSAVAYRTSNSITNRGASVWDKVSGMPSVWLLGCFNPTPTTTVFIPYRPSAAKVVNDEYFGKVPADRLKVERGFIFFRIDGKFRSKIGLPEDSACGLCGSYDSEGHVLTILKYDEPEGPCDYVNGQWGQQENCFGGDVINSYNDGPTETGIIMGPFYEVETSSPAAALAPGETLTHRQCTFHLEGPEEELDAVARKVFGISLSEVASAFTACGD